MPSCGADSPSHAVGSVRGRSAGHAEGRKADEAWRRLGRLACRPPRRRRLRPSSASSARPRSINALLTRGTTRLRVETMLRAAARPGSGGVRRSACAGRTPKTRTSRREVPMRPSDVATCGATAWRPRARATEPWCSRTRGERPSRRTADPGTPSAGPHSEPTGRATAHAARPTPRLRLRSAGRGAHRARRGRAPRALVAGAGDGALRARLRRREGRLDDGARAPRRGPRLTLLRAVTRIAGLARLGPFLVQFWFQNGDPCQFLSFRGDGPRARKRPASAGPFVRIR